MEFRDLTDAHGAAGLAKTQTNLPILWFLTRGETA